MLVQAIDEEFDMLDQEANGRLNQAQVRRRVHAGAANRHLEVVSQS
jgi:hypothetical protein